MTSKKTWNKIQLTPWPLYATWTHLLFETINVIVIMWHMMPTVSAGLAVMCIMCRDEVDSWHGVVVDRYASLARQVQLFHSFCTDGVLSTSDSCSSNHVSSLGWTDQWPSGWTYLPDQHSSMWFNFTHTGLRSNIWEWYLKVLRY